MATKNGRCNCGSITVSLASVPSITVACHCLNCRRAGGPFSINYVCREDEVSIRDSRFSLKEYQDRDTASGNLAKRNFCSECGSPIYTVDVTMPGKLLIKASPLNDVAASKTDVSSHRAISWA